MMNNIQFSKMQCVGSPNNQNYIIQGDNCNVCDILSEEYHSAVKCIYIDPPYNNGEEYSHYTDIWTHRNWLYNMEKILRRLFPLLSDNGSIWISIDDTELHYLKVLCDEIFGLKNFITTIVWQHRTTRENRRVFSNNHEYILLYAKNPALFKNSRNDLPLNPDVLNRYKNPDNDPRGAWQSISLNVQAGHAVKSQFYTITTPGGAKYDPPNGRCWAYNEERMLKEIDCGNIWFGVNGNGVPRKKKFLSDLKKGMTPETLWSASQAGTTNDAKKHILSLFPNIPVFDTPKPEMLIKQILEISSNEGDLILDAFLGSGTTAAVAHKLGRRYIGIDYSADSMNYAVERLKMVINGESGGISKLVGWSGGGGFHSLSLVTKKGYDETTESPEKNESLIRESGLSYTPIRKIYF